MESADKLKKIFSRFPTVGQRTAERFVYHLIKLPKEKADELINAIIELKNKVKLCEKCFNPFDFEGNVCQICKNPARNQQLLCIVEKESDLISIENTKKFAGLYFIFGGTVGMLRQTDNNHLRIEALKNRIRNNTFAEIIVALSPTPEGRTTSILIESAIKEVLAPLPKITHLAKGLPVGGEVEYADEETLGSALEGRK